MEETIMTENQEAVVTLYSVLQDPQLIYDAFTNHFDNVLLDVKRKEDGWILQLQDQSEMAIHIVSKQEEVIPQVQGMRNYFAQAPLENKELLEQICMQISLFNCITGITFPLDENEERTSYILNTIFDVAKDTASLVLYPTMSIYTADGELLISIEGESDMEEWHPLAHDDLLDQHLVYTKEDEERYQEISNELKENEYPYVHYMLHTQMNLDALDVPDIKEIAMRAICVFSCAVCAEGTLMENGNREIGLDEFWMIDERYHCYGHLSEKEQAYIDSAEEPEQITSVQFTWKYECCAVLLWALGLMEIDDSFTTLCDVKTVATIIRRYANMEELLQDVKRRTDEEILTYHTRALYYNWACVEAAIHDLDMPGIEPGVVQEYHYALNWLCNANDTRNWDYIVCNT